MLSRWAIAANREQFLPFVHNTKLWHVMYLATRWAPKELLQVAGCISRFARPLHIVIKFRGRFVYESTLSKGNTAGARVKTSLRRRRWHTIDNVNIALNLCPQTHFSTRFRSQITCFIIWYLSSSYISWLTREKSNFHTSEARNSGMFCSL